MLNRLRPSVTSPVPVPVAAFRRPGQSRLETLPTLVFDGIITAPVGGTHVAVAMGQISHTLRQQSFDALEHALRRNIVRLRREQAALPRVLPQDTWLGLAHALQHLVCMAADDMGLRPKPDWPTRWRAVMQTMRRFLGSDTCASDRSAQLVCEGIENLYRQDVLDAKAGRPFRARAAVPEHRRRLLTLAQRALELRELGPDVLRRRLAPWAHHEQCRRDAHADVAVERMVQAYATGGEALRLARLRLCSLPPHIELLASLRVVDLSYNPGIQKRPSALIDALPHLHTVSYAHFREMLRPGRTSRFLDLDDLDPLPA